MAKVVDCQPLLPYNNLSTNKEQDMDKATYMGRVFKVYSGKGGCMCGCNGKYSYTQEGADKHHPGYDVGDMVSERSVKIIAGKVFNDPNTNWTESQEYCFVEDREKNTIKVVFFKQ